jgi:hypothetical protein
MRFSAPTGHVLGLRLRRYRAYARAAGCNNAAGWLCVSRHRGGTDHDDDYGGDPINDHDFNDDHSSAEHYDGAAVHVSLVNDDDWLVT